jgi:DNA-binding XRE family transcriptional regulator
MTAVVDLKVVRQMLGMSKEDLARRLGISSFELDFIERRGTLSERMAERLANVMKDASLAEAETKPAAQPIEAAHE